MANLLPLMGAAGIYTLSAPFDKDLLPNTQYTCVSIREMVEIVNGGGDPFGDYYATPHSIDKSTYTADLANGVSIVGLQAANNSIVYVPSSYLAAYPDGGGVPYRVVVLSINMGAVPDSLDLSPIEQKIMDDVQDIIGVTSTVQSVVVSNVTLLDTATAQGLETARQALITNSTTDYSKLVQITAQRDAALQQVQELQNYILTLKGANPVPDPGPIPG